jgi:hypothetical protein
MAVPRYWPARASRHLIINPKTKKRWAKKQAPGDYAFSDDVLRVKIICKLLDKKYFPISKG